MTIRRLMSLIAVKDKSSIEDGFQDFGSPQSVPASRHDSWGNEVL